MILGWPISIRREVVEGDIVLPCEFCGNPAFEPDKHTCPGLMAAIAAELELRDLEAM